MANDPKALFEARDKVGIIRLNDPTALNAMSVQMAQDLSHALDQAFETSRALILTGAGRGFCAGAKLSADETIPLDASGKPDMGAGLESHINPILLRLRDAPIPWISAVRGPAAGVGCSLALAADMVVASDTASFIQAFARVGLAPDGGASWLLSRAIGRPRALEMMLLGEPVKAEKALEWGLINRLVPDKQLEDRALDLATRLADGPASLRLIRQAAWHGADASFAAALDHEREGQRLAGQTADHAEGVAAFLEKRPARFTGA